MSREAEEREEAQLDEASEQALMGALRAAWSPGELDAQRNQLLIELALEDPLAEPSEEELVESERLRRALDGEGGHPHADLALLLRAAHEPEPISEQQLDRLLDRKPDKPSSNVIYVAFGVAASVLAAAAALLLLVFPLGSSGPGVPAANLPAPSMAVSRSTAPLFNDKFATEDTTARIDRIAGARARDLRDNRYALWGVR